jgi:UDP-N-acetyl-2-amino-2-deoxyglucuronate dehydrogenase
MLTWIFGGVEKNDIYLREETKASGYLELKNARVRWFLSIDENDLPKEIQVKGQRTYRSILVNNEEIEFSGGFTELHTKSYEEILKGNGFGLESARKSIDIVHHLRNADIKSTGEFHPFIKSKI